MPLLYLAVAWLAGIALAKTFHPPWQALPVLALTAILVLILWRERPRVRLGAICALTLALGAGRFLLALPHFDATSLASYHDVGRVTVEGVVVGEPDEREGVTNLRVRVERLTLPGGATIKVNGLALVKTARYPRRHYGDRVRVEGVLETPPEFEGFSYREYLTRQGVHSLIRDARVILLSERQASPLLYHLFALKARARSVIASLLPEPQAALLTGILLGVEAGIPADLMDDFAATGTSHIIAISGFNITIVAGVLTRVAERISGKRRAVWIALGGVAIYTVLVGASAAVVRAALMGALYLLARCLGRSTYAPISLAAAAIAMTAWNPYILWDVGFQLSFAATIGLVLYADPLERGCERALTRFLSVARARKIVNLLRDALLVTLAAQITTTPLILLYFGRLSLITLVTNLLILPVQPHVMIIGGLALLLGLILRPLGQATAWVAWLFLTWTIEAVRLTGRLPGASVPAQVTGWMVWGYYVLLGLITWWHAQTPERRRALWARVAAHLGDKAIAGTAVVLLALALCFWRSLPDGQLHVFFLDVGQGDAILIQTPSGRQALIDGGPSQTALLTQLGRRMPFWDRTLDVVVLTHPDHDHIAGLLAVLERYHVGVIVWTPVGIESAEYEQWQRLVEREGAVLYRGEAGLRVTLDAGVDMTILWPEAEWLGSAEADVNNASVVARLVYGNVSLLLTGDIGAEAEHRLAADSPALRSTLLKVAHHGSCDSTTAEFLEAVNPQVAIISVGAENLFGHPCAETLRRLGNASVYRTDEHGAIEFVSDGMRAWVKTER